MLLALKIGPVAYMGLRNSLPENSVYRAGALKAWANYAEIQPVFLALGVLALIVDDTDMAQAVLGPEIFVVPRIVYLAAYVAGTPLVRSTVFIVDASGLLLMALAHI